MPRHCSHLSTQSIRERTKDDTMCRRRCGSGRVHSKQSVGVVHGVGDVSLRMRAVSTVDGGIGGVRSLRAMAICIPLRMSVHPNRQGC